MVSTDRTKKPTLFSRASPELAAQAQRVADREYDGNISMLVRIAVRRFMDEYQLTDELAEADPPDRGATIAATRQYLANAGIAPAELVR